MTSEQGTDRRLRLILAVAVVLRVGVACAAWLASPEAATFHTPDSPRYLALANSLATQGTFAIGGTPELWRLPGLPLLLVPGTWLGSPTAVFIGLQVLTGALMCVIIARTGFQIGGTRVGLVAAALIAIDPGLIVWTAFVLSDVPYALLVTVSLGGALVYVANPGGSTGALAIALTAATAGAYLRIVGYAFPMVLIALVLAATSEARKRHAVVAGLVVAMAIGVWHVRNGVAGGYWGFSTQVDRAIYLAGGAPVVAAESKETYISTRARMLGEIESANATSPSQTSAAMREGGLNHIQRAPLRFALTYLNGVVTVLLHPGSGPYFLLFRQLPASAPEAATRLFVLGRWADAWQVIAQRGAMYWLLTIAFGLANLALLAFAARGVLGLWRVRARGPLVLLVGSALYFLALSGGPDGDSRRRLPITPPLALLAACGLSRRA